MRTIELPRLLKRERTADVRTYRTSRVDLVRATLLVGTGQGHLKAQAQKAA